jgi:hypothetical protein
MAMRIPGGRATRIALGTAGGVLVALGVAQLVLPSIAAKVARDQLAKYGTVKSVSVHAFPAIELLWGHAQSATVRAGDLHMSVSQFDGLLPRMRGIERIDTRADSFQLGPLKLHEVRTEKRGDELSTQGTVMQSDLQSALPAGVQVQLVEGAGGTVEVRVGGSIFGVGASVLARLGAQGGKLVAEPQGFPFAGLGRITLFADAHLDVQSVSLSAQPRGAGDTAYVLALRARLR